MPPEGSRPASSSPQGRPRVVLISVIFNEVAHAGSIVERIRPLVEKEVVDAAVVVDDGSTDGTTEALHRASWVKLVRHEQRRGWGAAIRSGYRYALANRFDVLAIMAGNGKDDPGEVPRLLEPILNNQADYVQGSRFLEGGFSKGLPWHRRAAINMLTWVFQLFLFRRFSDCTNGFRAYRTSLLQDPRLDWDQAWLGNDYELEIYMHYKTTALGYRVVEVPVSKVYQRAKDGTYSKARLANWFTGLKPLFYLRFGLKK
jgi:dolichol-phosphate mannosyltransferase